MGNSAHPPSPPAAAAAPDTGARLRSWPTGDALVAAVRAETGTDQTLLSFSRGKDSIAAALWLRDRMAVTPFYCTRIPGLSWVEESLDYYERALFGGAHIHRVIHPATVEQLNADLYQSPARLAVTEAADLYEYTYQDVQIVLIHQLGLPADTLTATGLRAADSILRRTNIAKSGPVNRRKRTWQPIWDWDKDRVLGTIRAAGIKLPLDYRWFNRTFDGLMAEFLVPLKRERPADYRRILEFFPLAEAEVYRYEMMRRSS